MIHQKTAPNTQSRLHTGAQTQEFIKQKLEQKYKDSFEFISMARPGSDAPDLIVQINKMKLQFEIKGRDTTQSSVTFFDKSIRRGKRVELLDRMSSIFTRNRYTTFEEMIDGYRATNNCVGYPGDEGTPKSGKLPSELRTRNDHLISAQMHAILLEHFSDNGDNYFAVYNRKNEQTAEIFYTGYGPNPLNAPALPPLDFIALDTHGGSYKGSMRVAIKGHLIVPPSGLQL